PLNAFALDGHAALALRCSCVNRTRVSRIVIGTPYPGQVHSMTFAGDFLEGHVRKGLTPVSNKRWISQLAISLVTLLSAHLAFAFDGEATLKALRDRNKDTRLRALESPELAVCYSSDADDINCPANP